MESNDSPEIPDRGETSDIPGLLSGTHKGVCIVQNARFRQDRRGQSDRRTRVKGPGSLSSTVVGRRNITYSYHGKQTLTSASDSVFVSDENRVHARFLSDKTHCWRVTSKVSLSYDSA